MSASNDLDYEGWWNGTPADEDGTVLADPALWPAVNREHPRVALVSTSTHEVVSTWDRIACGEVAGYVPPADPGWPADSVVVLDADTGDVVQSFIERQDG